MLAYAIIAALAHQQAKAKPAYLLHASSAIHSRPFGIKVNIRGPVSP